MSEGDPPPDPPAAVVVVDDELAELHAAATSATAITIPSAPVRLFHGAERKAPPYPGHGSSSTAALPGSHDGSGRVEYVTLRQKLGRVSSLPPELCAVDG